MKITKVTTAILEANFNWNFVKIETDEKITGYGEVFLAPGLTAVIREYARLLIGEDPTSIDRVMRRMRLSAVHVSPGIAIHAILGLEAALLDLIGKKYRMPVWQILGGKYRDEVRIYADCHAGAALSSIDPLLSRIRRMTRSIEVGSSPINRRAYSRITAVKPGARNTSP